MNNENINPIKTIITATFIVDEADKEDIIESLEEQYYGHNVGMFYKAINDNRINTESIHYTL